MTNITDATGTVSNACIDKITTPCGAYVKEEKCKNDVKMYAVLGIVAGGVGGFLISRALRMK